jgi:hypothetical protein
MLLFLSAFFSLVLIDVPARGQTSELVRAAYLNTAYCVGAVDLYAERLANSPHRQAARRAGKVAGDLKTTVRQIANRFKLAGLDTSEPRARGQTTMSELLPASGSWRSGGAIPQSAVRQFEHCAALAGN